MARAVKAGKIGRPASKAPPAKPASASRRPSAAAASVPKPGKEELRAQVEKLERANATLRARSREAVRNAKAAAAHIAELEEQVEQLERKAASQRAASQKAADQKAATEKAATQKAASQEAPATASAKPAKAASTRARRQKPDIDPGDAVPPGVAAAEPLPMDETAKLAKENLEEHLKAD